MKTMNFSIHRNVQLLTLLVLTQCLIGCQELTSEDTSSQAQFAYLNPIPVAAPTPAPPPDRKATVRIGLLLDTSSSMDGLINQARAQLWKIVNELSKARYNGQEPTINIALYEYGNSKLSEESGYIRQISPMTSELDLISEYLFALTTKGGDEFCGQVIQTALTENNWSNEEGELNILFIAGNEEFIQGKVSYKEACRQAREKGITVNTIFCGNRQVGINQEWQRGADLAGGQYMSLEQNQKTEYIATPYDQQISDLNDDLNTTYLSYGKTGNIALGNQLTQDDNASSYSSANKSIRAISKSSNVYYNGRWDLVDANKGKDFDLSKVDRKYLADNLKELDDSELEAVINEQQQKRELFQKQIRDLGVKREQYIQEARKRTGKGNVALDDLMIKAIHAQGMARNFTFENGLGEVGIESAEFEPSSVDYPGFNKLTDDVATYRMGRMVDLNSFLSMSKDANTIILDTRSKAMYDAKHIRGAVHLNFSDFSDRKLAKVIPNKNTRILIYCNNNILFDPMYFARKSAPLALNIPTFINLVGYGYENVYELSDNIPVDHLLLPLEGKQVVAKKKKSGF